MQPKQPLQTPNKSDDDDEEDDLGNE